MGLGTQLNRNEDMKGSKKKYGPKGFIPPDRNQRLAAVALPRLAAAKVHTLLLAPTFPSPRPLPLLNTALVACGEQDERSRRLHAYLEEAVQDETAFRPIPIPLRTKRTTARAVCHVLRVFPLLLVLSVGGCSGAVAERQFRARTAGEEVHQVGPHPHHTQGP